MQDSGRPKFSLVTKTAIRGSLKTDQREGAEGFRSSFIERFLGFVRVAGA